MYRQVLIPLSILILSTCVRGQYVNCNGKGFFCHNSTHFYMCVDMGGGLTQTLNTDVHPCPENTYCDIRNKFECMEIPTTTPKSPEASVLTLAWPSSYLMDLGIAPPTTTQSPISLQTLTYSPIMPADSGTYETSTVMPTAAPGIMVVPEEYNSNFIKFLPIVKHETISNENVDSEGNPSELSIVTPLINAQESAVENTTDTINATLSAIPNEQNTNMLLSSVNEPNTLETPTPSPIQSLNIELSGSDLVDVSTPKSASTTESITNLTPTTESTLSVLTSDTDTDKPELTLDTSSDVLSMPESILPSHTTTESNVWVSIPSATESVLWGLKSTTESIPSMLTTESTTRSYDYTTELSHIDYVSTTPSSKLQSEYSTTESYPFGSTTTTETNILSDISTTESSLLTSTTPNPILTSETSLFTSTPSPILTTEAPLLTSTTPSSVLTTEASNIESTTSKSTTTEMYSLDFLEPVIDYTQNKEYVPSSTTETNKEYEPISTTIVDGSIQDKFAYPNLPTLTDVIYNYEPNAANMDDILINKTEVPLISTTTQKYDDLNIYSTTSEIKLETTTTKPYASENVDSPKNFTSELPKFIDFVNEILDESTQEHPIHTRMIQTTEMHPFTNKAFSHVSNNMAYNPATANPIVTSPIAVVDNGCQKPGQYPDDSSCHSYYMCNNNVRYKLICPYNMVYSPTLQKCTTAKEHCTNYNDFLCNKPGRFPDAKSCYSYFECQPNGPGFSVTRFHCPWYSSFQPSNGQCVTNNNACGCSQTPQTCSYNQPNYFDSNGDRSSINIFYPDNPSAFDFAYGLPVDQTLSYFAENSLMNGKNSYFVNNISPADQNAMYNKENSLPVEGVDKGDAYVREKLPVGVNYPNIADSVVTIERTPDIPVEYYNVPIAGDSPLIAKNDGPDSSYVNQYNSLAGNSYYQNQPVEYGNSYQNNQPVANGYSNNGDAQVGTIYSNDGAPVHVYDPSKIYPSAVTNGVAAANTDPRWWSQPEANNPNSNQWSPNSFGSWFN